MFLTVLKFKLFFVILLFLQVCSMCSMFNLYSKKPKILSRERQKLILDASTLLLVSSYTNTTPPAQPTNKNSLPIALTTTRIFRPSASFINFLTQVLTQHPCWLRLTAPLSATQNPPKLRPLSLFFVPATTLIAFSTRHGYSLRA